MLGLKKQNTVKYLLITIAVLIVITLIILFFKNRDKTIKFNPSSYSNEITQNDLEILANQLYSKLKGWSAYSLVNEYLKMLALQNQDFVICYNLYNELDDKTLKERIRTEWYTPYSTSSQLADALIDRMNELNLI